MHVLIVEDDPDVTGFLSTALTLEGHEVVSAGNGRDALQVLREAPPDLIVLDLWMPVMSGWEFMSELRCSDDPALRQIPVIAISADRHAPVRGMNLAAFLTKPIDVPRLLATAQSVGA